MQTFNIIQPSALLRRYIRYYWILESNGMALSTERTLPFGCMQMIFHKKKRPLLATTHEAQPRYLLCGQGKRYIDLLVDGDTEMIVVVFQPHAAKLLLRLPVSLVQGATIAIEDLEDRELCELTRKIADTELHERCIARIEETFMRRLALCADYNMDRLSAVIRHITLQPDPDVSQLADITCLCNKQFTRIFTDYIGTSPKEFMRIIRLQRALFLWQQDPTLPFSQVAYSCGFADQSHMIREFKLFTGYTPKNYLLNCAPISDFFSCG